MSEERKQDRAGTPERDTPVTCDEIRSLLFDYMTRELGRGRSDLVREHLRRCQDCQAAAAEIQATLELLHQASDSEDGVPSRLSEERRERLIWAFTHPVMHWIERHHVMVSIAVALVVLGLVLGVLRRTPLWPVEDIPEGIPVTIGRPPGQQGTNYVGSEDIKRHDSGGLNGQNAGR